MFPNKRHLCSTLSQTDEQLWLAIAVQSCSKSFSILFNRYWSLIYKTAFTYTKDKELSEGITHDIFVNLWDKRTKLQIRSFSGYLSMAARYHVYKSIKSSKNLKIELVDQWDLNIEPQTMETADGNIGYQEALLSVQHSLSVLPARCQQIFRMSRFEELTNEEIAQKLGISKRSVENQITTALQFLRENIKPIINIFILFNFLA